MKFREYEEQLKIFEWAKLHQKRYPCLKYLNSSQNGLKINSLKSAIRAKKAGMKKGYPDIYLPYKNNCYAGLFIELKAPKPASSKVSEEQKDWINYLNTQNYLAVIIYGGDDAINLINLYINNANLIYDDVTFGYKIII